jgi:hypothetical protein
LPRLDVSSSPSVVSLWYLLLVLTPTRHLSPPPSLLDDGDIRGGTGPMWTCKTVTGPHVTCQMTWKNDYRRRLLDSPSVQTSEHCKPNFFSFTSSVR